MNWKQLGKRSWIWSLFGSAVLFVLICLISGKLNAAILRSNLVLASYLILMSLGQSAVMTGGDGAIDLSVQYMIAFAAYIASWLTETIGLPLGVFVTIAICGAVGACSGIINVYLKVPAMITTLSIGYILYSSVLMISCNLSGVEHEAISWFSQKARFLGLSPIVFLAIFAAILIAILFYRTPYGRKLHAVGQNRRAAAVAGIKVNRIVISTFVISATLSSIAGILLGGYFGKAFQDMGLSYMLICIAATVIGGTNAGGGKSSVLGTCTSAFMLMMLSTFLNISGFSAGLQDLIQGSVLILILVASVPKKTVNV